MLPSLDLSARVPLSLQPDWPVVRHAMLRSVYAGLLVLVMLLPANFVAFALFATLCHGTAIAGLHYAAQHHVAGYWVASPAGPLPAAPIVWWAAAAWEVLFWASCGSAVVVFVLWVVRFVAGRLAVHSERVQRQEQRTQAA
jgi:hypothetical protein